MHLKHWYILVEICSNQFENFYFELSNQWKKRAKMNHHIENVYMSRLYDYNVGLYTSEWKKNII